jgi:hypothetical protein
MTPVEAERIVNEYGAVLEETSSCDMRHLRLSLELGSFICRAQIAIGFPHRHIKLQTPWGRLWKISTF